MTPESINEILKRFVDGQYTEVDINDLRVLLDARNPQNSEWFSKYVVNIGKGQDIKIGDTIYCGSDAETIKSAVKEALQEYQNLSSTFNFSDETEISSYKELLSNIKQYSERIKKQLEPYILPRIERTAILHKCLKYLRLNLDQNKATVIPLIGPAGYGKSTILGSIYEAIQSSSDLNTRWLALIRCNELVGASENLSYEMGEKVSGLRKSIIEVANTLSKSSSGILLIDTVDILLTENFVPIFRDILQQLLDCKTSVIFTCRDQDFRDYFEPYHENFAGFFDKVRNYEIPCFTEEEVRNVTDEFLKIKLKVESAESRIEFVDRIIRLSANNNSLQKITRNPLLLALLCDLFEELQRNIPADLTVSQLYEKYWTFRIAKGYRQRTNKSRIGYLKNRLCLNIAGDLYHRSEERLRDYFYESSLSLNDTELDAYKELKSGDVLQGVDRIFFFHQTFLEYAIARWLCNTDTGETAKSQLLQSLTVPETIHQNRLYVWAILRQLLTIVSLDEFKEIFSFLDKNHLLTFRTIAYATASRTEAEMSSNLTELLEIALTLEEEFIEIVLIAISSASPPHRESAWHLVMRIMLQGSQRLADKAAELSGELLPRLQFPHHDRFKQLFQAIENRSHSLIDQDQTTVMLLGKFMGAYLNSIRTLNTSVEPGLIQAFRDTYFAFGSKARSIILELYLMPNVAELMQVQLLKTIIQKPTSEQFLEKKQATILLHRLLPKLMEMPDSPFGQSWLEVLQVKLKPKWYIVQAGAVACEAVINLSLLEALTYGLLWEQSTDCTGKLLSQYKIVLDEVIASGATDLVVDTVVKFRIQEIPSNRISTLVSLIRQLVSVSPSQGKLMPCLGQKIIEWLAPIIPQYPVDLISILDSLIENEITARRVVEQFLEPILPSLSDYEISTIAKNLRQIPVQLEVYLRRSQELKDSRLALVRLLFQKATDQDSKAIEELLQLCLNGSKKISIYASKKLLELASTHYQEIPVGGLIQALKCQNVIEAKRNCLKICLIIAEFESLSEEELLQIFQVLSQEKTPEVLQCLYKFVEVWINTKHYFPLPVAHLVFEITKNLVIDSHNISLNRELAQPAFIAIKNIANLGDDNTKPRLIEITHFLMYSIDVERVNNSFVIGLLDKISRFDNDFLKSVIHQYLADDSRFLPVSNILAIVIAIVNSQSRNSVLLDELLIHPKVPPQVKSLIYRERGM